MKILLGKDESSFDQVIIGIRRTTFNFLHLLLQNQICSIPMYKLLIVIESLQMIYYSFNPHMNYLFKNDLFDYFQKAFMYFQVGPVIEQSGVDIFYLIFYIIITILGIILIVLLISVSHIDQALLGNSIIIYMLKFLSICVIMLMTILVIPMTHMLFVLAYCVPDSIYNPGIKCYQDQYYVHFVISIIAFIVFLTLTFLLKMFYCDLKQGKQNLITYFYKSPNSQAPFAQPQSKTSFLRLLIKVTFPIYLTLDYKFTIIKGFIIFLMIYYTMLLVVRFKSLPFFNKSIQQLTLFTEIILWWSTVVSFIHAFLDVGQTNDLGFLYFIIGIPLMLSFAQEILERKKTRVLHVNIRQMKSEVEFEFYLYTLIELIENHEDVEKKITLEGVLNLHTRQCSKPNTSCQCRNLQMEFSREDEQNVRQIKWYQLVRSLLEDGLERFPKCTRLHLLTAFLLHEKLQNKFKAIYELIICQECRPNLQEEFTIYRFKFTIEEAMKESEVRKFDSKFELNQIFSFQNDFIWFQVAIEQSVNLHLEFWRELLEENLDIQKLQSLGTRITVSLEFVEDLFQKLMITNSNEIKCLLLYGNFLIDIINEESDGIKLIEKIVYIRKTSFMNKYVIDEDKKKYGENSNTCIITCTGNYNNTGIVFNCNNEITRILGFTKNDVIGQRVNRLMPKIYSDMHDGFMKRFLETSESKIMGIERIIMAQNKDGYLICCSLMIIVLPNLNEGIQIVGFLKEIEEQNILSIRNEKEKNQRSIGYILYNSNTNALLGITQNCYDHFGIPASLVFGNGNNTSEFALDSIMPEVFDQNNYEALKNNGIVCEIDTTMLKEHFFIGQNDSDEEMDDQLRNNHYEHEDHLLNSNINTNNNVGVVPVYFTPKPKRKANGANYRKTKVRVLICDERFFEDINITTLQVVEERNELIGDTEENKDLKPKSSDLVMEVAVVELQSQSDENLNEELRQLKDFKTLMSEKSENKNIRFLKRSVILLTTLLVSLTTVHIVYQQNQTNDMTIGQRSIYDSFDRRKVIASLCFDSRMLDLLSKGYYLPTDSQNQTDIIENILKSLLSMNVQQLQSIQFSLMKARINLNSDQLKNVGQKEIPVTFMLQTGVNKTYLNLYDDGLFQFITSVSALRNSTLSSFNQSDTVESTQKNLYYIINNGLYALRKASEEIAEQYLIIYQLLNDQYYQPFLVVLILGILFLFLSQMIIIPIVFKVNYLNYRVLSLFGLIKQNQVKELVEQCERYKSTFLEEHKQIVEEGIKLVELKKDAALPIQYLEAIIDDIDQSVRASDRYLKNDNISVPDREIRAKQALEKKEDEDTDNVRSQKLLNSKTNNQINVMLKFFLITAILISYFSILYLLQQQFRTNSSLIYGHLNVIGRRFSAYKLSTFMSYEEIIKGSPLIEDNVDLRIKLSERVYQNERDIFQSLITELPSQFDNYITQFNDINYYSICVKDFSNPKHNFKMNQTECMLINKGLLIKGLTTTIISMSMSSQELITQFYSQSNAHKNISEYVNSLDFVSFKNLHIYVDASQDYLGELYLSGMDQFLKDQTQLTEIIVSLIAIFLFVIYLFVWRPYTNDLSISVWRTKGMLNMIPMQIIQNQENLKLAFIQGDIIQAIQ